MCVDTDVVLAGLKVDDWLSDAVDAASIADPKTSVVTAEEVQLVMFEAWSRDQLATVARDIEAEGIELLTLTAEVHVAGGSLLATYEALNVFDAAHLGHTLVLEEPIVSTDILYPDVGEVEGHDPREL